MFGYEALYAPRITRLPWPALPVADLKKNSKKVTSNEEIAQVGTISSTRPYRTYPDVANAGVNPLAHYEQFGWKEGRDPSAHFDTTGYLAANPDVAAAHVNPLDHYLTNGIYEGRTVVNDGLWG